MIDEVNKGKRRDPGLTIAASDSIDAWAPSIDPSENVISEIHREDLREAIFDAALELSDRKRDCIAAELEDISNQTTSDQLGISESTARVHRFNARKKLRENCRAGRRHKSHRMKPCF